MNFSNMDYRPTLQCEVWWAGFKSDTYTLAREGWQAAIEQMPMSYSDGMRLILKHESLGWAMYCVSHEPYGMLMEYAHHRFGGGGRLPVFVVQHARLDHQMVFVRDMPLNRAWRHVDIAPRMVEQPLNRSGIFPDYREQSREIIVAPDKVADLLERITKLQEPELQAIRERNRTREYAERAPEIRHATILSIAA